MIYSFSSQSGYHKICRQIAQSVKILVPYICYRMFPREQKAVIGILCGKRADGFLIFKHSKFILWREGNEETVSLNFGYTIGSASNAEKWEEFPALLHSVPTGNEKPNRSDATGPALQGTF